jgi:hypothetical protein
VRQPTAKDFLRQVSARFRAKGARFNDPIVWHRPDSCPDVLSAAFTGHDKVEKRRIRPLEHEKSVAESSLFVLCGWQNGDKINEAGHSSHPLKSTDRIDKIEGAT